MTETALTRQDVADLAASRYGGFDRDQIDIIKSTIAKGTTDDELALFCTTAKRMGLDPFARQIHAVKRWDRQANREVMSIQTGIDGYRLTAHRTGDLEGIEGPFWCGADGQWREVWLDEKQPPAAAKVVVYRKGCARPFVGVATWREFAQFTKDGKLTSMWAGKSSIMIGKCAESQALRKAFPNELAGIYTPEEMGADEEPAPVFERPATPESLAAAAAVVDERKARNASRKAAKDEPPAVEVAPPPAAKNGNPPAYVPKEGDVIPATTMRPAPDMPAPAPPPGPAPAARDDYAASQRRVEEAARAAAAAEEDDVPFGEPEPTAAPEVPAEMVQFRAALREAKDRDQLAKVAASFKPWSATPDGLPWVDTLKKEWVARNNELKAGK